MTKNKVRNYNEKKAKRALSHQNTLIRKLERSLNNRTDSEKAWDAEIQKIKGAYVSVMCDVCNKPHQVEFEEWRKGQFGRTCYKCRVKLDNAEKQKIVNLIKPLLPEGCEVFADTDGWLYGKITIHKARIPL